MIKLISKKTNRLACLGLVTGTDLCVYGLEVEKKTSLKVIKVIRTGSYMSVITTLINPTAEGSLHIFQANLKERVFHWYFSSPGNCDLGKIYYIFFK